MSRFSRAIILKECGERIEQADIMVQHYETLGHEDNKRLMQIESKKWEYLFGLVEEDIVQHPTKFIEIDDDQEELEYKP